MCSDCNLSVFNAAQYSEQVSRLKITACRMLDAWLKPAWTFHPPSVVRLYIDINTALHASRSLLYPLVLHYSNTTPRTTLYSPIHPRTRTRTCYRTPPNAQYVPLRHHAPRSRRYIHRRPRRRGVQERNSCIRGNNHNGDGREDHHDGDDGDWRTQPRRREHTDGSGSFGVARLSFQAYACSCADGSCRFGGWNPRWRGIVSSSAVRRPTRSLCAPCYANAWDCNCMRIPPSNVLTKSLVLPHFYRESSCYNSRIASHNCVLYIPLDILARRSLTR
ncbi:unnamed protein product [Periconia digitata]|uniref:Uncharacterized protein n=1 Tax=Periconia digitata TaxID=1303443 RepID=A0A9W4UNL9_9PLEO|nr:unnamed protein product [Periconia digitata]